MLFKKLRQEEWKKKQRQEDMEMEDRVWRTHEVLEEDIQNHEVPMVLIGCDVEALYPSLDVKECGDIVMDYLEGARMIALNRSADFCRRHELSRILPVRRSRTGSRPGV